MNNKMRKLSLLLIGGIVFSVLSTGIVYRFFPQYLCYTVYDVSEGNLYQKEELEMSSGSLLTERFVPTNDYMIGIDIGVKREENANEFNENELIGRLSDDHGRTIAESSFTVRDVEYRFTFHKWVEPGKEYQLDILLPEENQSAVVITFGPGDTVASEHTATYIDGASSDLSPYISYIYGTYSKKLLAFWLLVFFLCGFMIGETVLCKIENRDSDLLFH